MPHPTQGEWLYGRLDADSFLLYSQPADLDQPCSDLATVSDVAGFPDGTAEANVRLMSAAPSLLAACRKLLEFFESVRPGGPMLRGEVAAYVAAHEAIAKATGSESASGEKARAWWINKNEPAPSMNTRHQWFYGTFEGAVRAACDHYVANATGATVTFPNEPTSSHWFRIDEAGNCVDRNTPDRRFTGHVSSLGLG